MLLDREPDHEQYLLKSFTTVYDSFFKIQMPLSYLLYFSPCCVIYAPPSLVMEFVSSATF